MADVETPAGWLGAVCLLSFVTLLLLALVARLWLKKAATYPRSRTHARNGESGGEE